MPKKLRLWPNLSPDLMAIMNSLGRIWNNPNLKYETHGTAHRFGSLDQLLDRAKIDPLDLT